MFWTCQFLVGFFTKIQSLSVSNWYCWLCKAFGKVFFCSQKINLFVFLIGIADHAGPLVTHSTEWRKERKKPKATLKYKTNLAVRPRFFYGPFLPILYCINMSFCYIDAVCSAATGVLFMWIPCGIHMFLGMGPCVVTGKHRHKHQTQQVRCPLEREK
jgi:hypothetical protein